MHAHQQGGLRRRPLPAVYLQAKIAIAQQTLQRDAATNAISRGSRPFGAVSLVERPSAVQPAPGSGSRRLRGTRSSARPRSSCPYRRDGRLRGRCGLTLAARGQPPFVNSPFSVIVIKHLLAELAGEAGFEWCRSYIRSSGAVTVLAVAEEVAP